MKPHSGVGDSNPHLGPAGLTLDERRGWLLDGATNVPNLFASVHQHTPDYADIVVHVHTDPEHSVAGVVSFQNYSLLGFTYCLA